jgi:hypothetical protein
MQMVISSLHGRLSRQMKWMCCDLAELKGGSFAAQKKQGLGAGCSNAVLVFITDDNKRSERPV